MDILSIPRNQTFFNNGLIETYLQSDKLASFYTYSPSIESIEKAIAAKSTFPQDRRTRLVEDLILQYKEAGINLKKADKVSNNIHLLKSETAYTVTTGQQIHLGLGPMYVLYKILDTIALVDQLNKKYKRYQFVPVFWMATEDHDLEEIATVSYFGRQKKWETNQSGAVGRMSPKGVSELFEEFLFELNLSEDQNTFLKTLSVEYKKSKTLSQAYRRVLHHYFSDLGLVIIDADSRELKSSFKPVMEDELIQKNNQALRYTTSQLESMGFAKQLRTRPCNLFLLQKNDRVRIDKLYPISEASVFVAENSENLSPNAALRPLYQEWILPNLVYVGGPSEIHYWMQLKGLFNNYEMPVPYLHLRTSCIVLPPRMRSKYSLNQLSDFFQTEKEIAVRHNSTIAKLVNDLAEKKENISKTIKIYNKSVEQAVTGFSLDSKWKKIIPKIEHITSLVDEQIDAKIAESTDLKQMLKVKEQYFNPAKIQERSEHIGAHVELLKLNSKSICQHFGFVSLYNTMIIQL